VASSSAPDQYPPKGAPEETVWFGGPVDQAKVTLRIFGEQLDPDEITRLLGCAASSSARIGESTNQGGVSRIAREGFWRLSNGKSDVSVEDQIAILLARLTTDLTVWQGIAARFKIDLFCGLFLDASNRGFALRPELMRQLVGRGITIGFDIYGPDAA
jgi:hypothetical protein